MELVDQRLFDPSVSVLVGEPATDGLEALAMDHVVLAAFWVKALPEVTRWRNLIICEKIQRTGDLQLW